MSLQLRCAERIILKSNDNLHSLLQKANSNVIFVDKKMRITKNKKYYEYICACCNLRCVEEYNTYYPIDYMCDFCRCNICNECIDSHIEDSIFKFYGNFTCNLCNKTYMFMEICWKCETNSRLCCYHCAKK